MRAVLWQKMINELGAAVVGMADVASAKVVCKNHLIPAEEQIASLERMFPNDDALMEECQKLSKEFPE